MLPLSLFKTRKLSSSHLPTENAANKTATKIATFTNSNNSYNNLASLHINNFAAFNVCNSFSASELERIVSWCKFSLRALKWRQLKSITTS